MRLGQVVLWLGLAQMLAPSGAADAQTLRDYSLMTHRVFIDSLRAGNHDESGVNDYFFTYKLRAVRNTTEDLVKDLKDRPFSDQDPKTFGEVSVPVLSQWQPGSKKAGEELFIDVTGDEIRAIVAASMREFKVKEREVALAGVVEMWERNKVLGYFGEDLKIGEVRYFPIPASEYHAAARTNLKLNLEDDIGTLVVVKVRYESPRTSSARGTGPAEKDKPADSQPAAEAQTPVTAK